MRYHYEACSKKVSENIRVEKSRLQTPSSYYPCPAWSFQHVPPIFGYDERGVYIALREVYLPTFFEVLG